ncbi:MAG: M67 family peptidase [Alphaproteobacteria bacterium]|nr:MAG: M67 family peptidase [Alphaproteobacteria bacterium]
MKAAHRATIAAVSRAAWPREACGLALGSRIGVHDYRIVRLVEVANILAEAVPDRFEMDPKALLAQHRAARAQGLAVIGHFHSHPNGRPVPSATDAQWAHEPGVLWLIQALDATAIGPLAAFRATGAGPRAAPFCPLAIAIYDA